MIVIFVNVNIIITISMDQAQACSPQRSHAPTGLRLTLN